MKGLVCGGSRLRDWEKKLRAAVSWVAFCAGVLLFMIPVAGVQMLLTVSNLKLIPGVSELFQIPLVPSLISGILPSLALTASLRSVSRVLSGRFPGFSHFDYLGTLRRRFPGYTQIDSLGILS